MDSDRQVDFFIRYNQVDRHWAVGIGNWLDQALYTTILQPGRHFLDGNAVIFDGLKIAGASGIIGNPKRHFRRTENDYVDAVCDVVEKSPDILVLHDGPAGPEPGQLGCQVLTEMLEIMRPTLIVRGHAGWDPWFVTLRNGSQVVNVDAKVLLLTEE